jgi:hypothetical protein
VEQFIAIFVGGVLAIVGGILGAWYQTRLAIRTAKRERFRAIYHALLAVASATRTFARARADDALLDDGTVAEWWLRYQQGELHELVEFFREARKSASWLDFESDLRSVEGKLRFSTLDWTYYSYQMALERLNHDPSQANLAALLAAKQSLEECADDLARAIRQHMIELELPMPVLPRRNRRRANQPAAAMSTSASLTEHAAAPVHRLSRLRGVQALRRRQTD